MVYNLMDFIKSVDGIRWVEEQKSKVKEIESLIRDAALSVACTDDAFSKFRDTLNINRGRIQGISDVLESISNKRLVSDLADIEAKSRLLNK